MDMLFLRIIVASKKIFNMLFIPFFFTVGGAEFKCAFYLVPADIMKNHEGRSVPSGK